MYMGYMTVLYVHTASIVVSRVTEHIVYCAKYKTEKVANITPIVMCLNT